MKGKRMKLKFLIKFEFQAKFLNVCEVQQKFNPKTVQQKVFIKI